jgi:hypothetical protein
MRTPSLTEYDRSSALFVNSTAQYTTVPTAMGPTSVTVSSPVSLPTSTHGTTSQLTDITRVVVGGGDDVQHLPVPQRVQHRIITSEHIGSHSIIDYITSSRIQYASTTTHAHINLQSTYTRTARTPLSVSFAAPK